MKRQILNSTVRLLCLPFLLTAAFALAQASRQPVHFTGLINDYSPLDANVKGSPWEMHGQWMMDLRLEEGTADFSADMTMSGFGRTAAGAVDPTQPLLNPHTHHIRLTNMRISWDMVGCPAYLTPVPTAGFQINGTMTLITGNGSKAPFETTPPTSTLQVCVTGVPWTPGKSSSVANANMTMVFGGPASTHFGPQALHGVVEIAPGAPGDSDRNTGGRH